MGVMRLCKVGQCSSVGSEVLSKAVEGMIRRRKSVRGAFNTIALGVREE